MSNTEQATNKSKGNLICHGNSLCNMQRNSPLLKQTRGSFPQQVAFNSTNKHQISSLKTLTSTTNKKKLHPISMALRNWSTYATNKCRIERGKCKTNSTLGSCTSSNNKGLELFLPFLIQKAMELDIQLGIQASKKMTVTANYLTTPQLHQNTNLGNFTILKVDVIT